MMIIIAFTKPLVISQLMDLLINEVCLLTLVSEYTKGLVLISSYQNTVLIISTNIVDN